MAEQTCPCCGADLRISCNTAHPEHDCYHPDGHTRPQPDWADLREMARNAGYQLRRTTEGGGIRSDMRGCIRHTSHWEIEPAVVDHSIAQPIASLDLIHWWWQAEGEEESGFVVHLNVEDRCGTEAHVESASPAQALAAARLVGLVGAS